MTRVYLAWGPSGSVKMTFADWDWDAKPVSLLVSYVYHRQYLASSAEGGYAPARLMLDSGAFSAYKSGRVVDIEALTVETMTGRWQESVALDVIGDHQASLENARWMREQGSTAFPVFHFGEPWELLAEYVEGFGKVGLSCCFGEPKREALDWLGQCFARHWPHRFHSFGWVDVDALASVPFHSADTASWFGRPDIWANWRAFGGRRLSVKGQKDMKVEVEHFLQLEQEMRFAWRREMKQFPPDPRYDT